MNKLACPKSALKKKLPMLRPGMKKTAQDTATSFNETVPSTDTGMPLATDQQGQIQNAKNTIVNEASDPYAVTPQGYGDESQMEQPQMDFSAPPEMIGAAHSFLGPEVMQNAMSGDPNAQDLIARTAAQVGSTFMNMSSNAAAMSQGGIPEGMEQAGMQPGMEGVQPGMEQQQGITSPEDDLASELVPNIEPPPNPADMNNVPGNEQPGQNGEQQNVPDDNEKVDMATVSRLIQLAKAGKI